ncbi:MAG: metal ABC transporter substrate-binding protein [Lactobacillaceae bacterium]|jgi:zinc transport system substrate-binding protein|nr:metal ABC transporter substrate-binding protein [Lactobacillaceae bacterium]
MKKKIVTTLAFTLIIVASLLVIFAPSKNKNNSKISIVTSNVILKSMVNSIGGKYVQVSSLTTNGSEIHDFNPTPSQIKKLTQADLYIKNGLGLEPKLNDKPKKTLVASEGILSVKFKDGNKNPHAYLSFLGISTYLKNITSELIEIDTSHKSFYEANLKNQLIELQKLEKKYLSKDHDFTIVTDEDAFAYLAKELKFDNQFVEQILSNQSVSPKKMADFINQLKKEKNVKLLSSANESSKTLQTIGDGIDKKISGSVFVDGLDNKKDYLQTFKENLEVIYE